MSPSGGIDSQHKILLMVGFHAKAVASLSDPGTAILPHTVHDPIADIRYDGRSLGEIGLFAGCFGALASHDSLGMPWGLPTGDKAACDEARDLSAAVEVAAVKERLTDCSERLLVHSREGYMWGFAGYFDVVGRRLGSWLRCWQGRLFASKLRRNGVLSL